MAIAVSVVKTFLGQTDASQQYQIIRLKFVLTGNYGGAATHGDTVNLSTVYGIQSKSVPVHIDLYEAPPAGTATTGYIWTFCPGTNQTNGVLNIMSGVAAEYTQGSAYSAALLGVALYGEAWFPAFV